jgi:tRNA-splicing ligase RtcB
VIPVKKGKKATRLENTRPDVWEIPKEGEMLVPGRLYVSADTVQQLLSEAPKKEWDALKQIENVACLPGIQMASLAMSDVHPGYGFPIGGVGAFDAKEGVISVAGVGFDCNCGVRTLATTLGKKDVERRKIDLINEIFRAVPAGVGSTGQIKLNEQSINKVLVSGAKFAVEKGYGTARDLEYTEENGAVPGADPKAVSAKAKRRQFKQVGTLGSGNHYLEIQYVDEIYDNEAAAAYGLETGQVLVSIHCGSRALGHQIGTDYLQTMEAASRKYKIPIRERELVCAPFGSPEGQAYFSAVKAAMNCAFANRQILSHLVRGCFERVLGLGSNEVTLFYDIGHNTCKLENHGGKRLVVHRKGATRAFGPGHPEIPAAYRAVGQPVLVGGTMGTCSYILKGTEKGMEETFGSACHGAGRVMSRQQAKKRWMGRDLVKDLESKGIAIRGHSLPGVAEEAPGAYKDVSDVVGVMHRTGIAMKVVRTRPMACLKG